MTSREVAVYEDPAGRVARRYGRGSRVLARLHRDLDLEPVRSGPLYLLDFRRFGVRLTGGWYRTPWRSRVPAADETWILEGFSRESALEFVEIRREQIAAAVAPLEVLNPDGSIAVRSEIARAVDNIGPPPWPKMRRIS